MELDDLSDLDFDVSVARGLAAPGTSVDIYRAIFDAKDRVVVIKKVCPFDILHPKPAVGALSCS